MDGVDDGNAIASKFSVESWINRMERNTQEDNLNDELVDVDNEAKERAIFEAQKHNLTTVEEMKEYSTAGTEIEIDTDGKKGLEIAALKAIVMSEKAAAAERMAQEAEAEKIAADNALVQAVAEDERHREDMNKSESEKQLRLVQAPTTEADAVAFVIATARKLQSMEMASTYRGGEFALEEIKESNERSYTEFSESTSKTNSKPVSGHRSNDFQRIFCNTDTSNDIYKTQCLSPSPGALSRARSQSNPDMSTDVQSTSTHRKIQSSNLNMEDSHSTTNAYLSTNGKPPQKNKDSRKMQNLPPTSGIVKTNKGARMIQNPSPTPRKMKTQTPVRQKSNPKISSSVQKRSTRHSMSPSACRTESEHPSSNQGYTSLRGSPRHSTPTEKNPKKGFFSLFRSNPKPKVSPINANKKVLPNNANKKLSMNDANMKAPRETASKRALTHKRDPTPQKRIPIPSSTPERHVSAAKKRSVTPQRTLKSGSKSRHRSRCRGTSRSVSRGSSVKSIEKKVVADSATASKGAKMRSTKKSSTPHTPSKKNSGALNDDIPTISNWERKADGTITGNVSNAHNYEDGMAIRTAPVTGRIVVTDSGHRYRLI